MENLDIRYKQRLQNFERALLLLRSAYDEKKGEFSDLEKEGISLRFEYTFELAWKTLKDYLIYQGIKLEQSTPREVIKQGFAAGVIKNGDHWLEMLAHRNLLSHTYDFQTFSEAVEAIEHKYIEILDDFYLFTKAESLNA